MNLSQLKLNTLALPHTTPAWVRDTLSDLRQPANWRTKYDRASNFATTAADRTLDAIHWTIAVLAPLLWAMLLAVCFVIVTVQYFAAKVEAPAVIRSEVQIGQSIGVRSSLAKIASSCLTAGMVVHSDNKKCRVEWAKPDAFGRTEVKFEHTQTLYYFEPTDLVAVSTSEEIA